MASRLVEPALSCSSCTKCAPFWRGGLDSPSFRCHVAERPSGKQSVWTYLAFGYMVAMLANALIPHIAVSVATRSYMPGVATAVALNLPVLSLLVVLALRDGYVSGWKAAAYSAAVPGLLLLSHPGAVQIGKNPV